jgi:hypothetical protein
MPMPPCSPSQFSVLFLSGSWSNMLAMCPFFTPAMLRKFRNHVVDATCARICKSKKIPSFV